MASPQKSSSKFPKFPKAVAAVGLAAVLVGCGGGGSETAKTGSDEMVPMPITDAKGELATAEGAVNALPANATYEQKRDAWKKVKDKADELKVVLVANNGSAGDISRAELTSTRANENYEKQVKYITAINKIKGSYNTVKSLVDGLTASSPQLTVDSVRDQVNGFLEDVRKEANLPESERTEYRGKGTTLLSDIAGKNKAVMDETKRLANFNLWKQALSAYSISPASKIDELPDRKANAADPNDTTLITNTDGTFNFTYDGGRPSTANPITGLPISRWKGTEFSKNYGDGRIDSGRFFTNRGGKETMTWGELYTKHGANGYDRNYLGADVVMSDPAAGIGTIVLPATPTFGPPLTEGTSKSMIHKDNVGQIPSDEDKTDYSVATTERVKFGTPIPTGNNYTAMLFGRPGAFTCTNRCTIDFDDNGFLTVASTTAGTTLTFTPAAYDSADRKVNAVTANADRLADHEVTRNDMSFADFGYWKHEKTGTSPTLTIDTFARAHYGNEGRGLTNSITTITGSATYTGLSAGYYVLDDDGGKNGEFTAKVELTADFDKNHIGGYVDEFTSVTSSEHSLTGWNALNGNKGLKLDSANFTDSASGFMAFGNKTSGGGKTNGNWQGTFYGNAGTSTIPATDDVPKAVVGEYKGIFTNGHVAGAFGAETPEK